MPKLNNLNMFKNLNVIVDLSEHTTLDSTWKRDNVCDIYSRLYYVKSGTGFLRCGQKEIKLEPGNVYLVPSGCNFSYGCETLEKIFFHIYVPTVENYDLLSNIKDILALPFPKSTYQTLLDCFCSDSYLSLLKMKNIILDTVLNMLNAYGKDIAVKNYPPLIQNAMKYVNDNAKISLTAKEISTVLFVSETSLRKAFKNATAVSLGKYIDDIVFITACRMLSDDNNSIKAISNQLNFCDQFYFSRWFKKIYGYTPSAYKRMLSSK